MSLFILNKMVPNILFPENVKRILILGHTGFVGNRLLDFFTKKYPFLEIMGKSSQEINLIDEDDSFKLRDYFDLKTVVIMTSGIKSNYGDDLNTFKKNIQMAENICNLLSKSPVSKFLFFSSIAVYGVDTNNSKITEKTPVNPDSYYGLSKFVSEELFRKQFSKSDSSDSSLIILRTPTIYGPHEKIKAQTPSGFLTTYLEGGEVTLWGDGSDLRELLFLEDLVQAIDLLLSANFTGIINLGDGQGHSYKESLDIISKLLEKELIIHSRERTKDKVDKVFDNSLFNSLFPNFSFTSLKLGLQTIIAAEMNINNQGKKCPLCQRKKVQTLIDFGKQPVSNRFLLNSAEEEKIFQLSFGQCQSCGLAQLTEKIPLNELIPHYSWVTYVEPEEHLDSLAETIKNLPDLTLESKILGISFKDGSILKRMNSLGFTKTKILTHILVANRQDLGLEDNSGVGIGVEIIQSKLTPDGAQNIVRKEGQFEIVIARHILEHAYNLPDFINSLKTLLSPKGYLILEVPDCAQAFEKKDYAVIWEDHLSYFTPTTFQQVFQNYGLKLEHFENYPYPLENSLIGIGRKVEDGKQFFLPDDKLKKEKLLVNSFAEHFAARKILLQNYFSQSAKNNEKIALLGAGHFACGFINYLNLQEYIECVIDDNPHKNGLLMPGSKLPIYGSAALLDKEIKFCLLSLNPRSEDQVIAKNNSFIEKGGKFFSIFAASDKALPPLKEGIKVENIKVEKINDEVFVTKDEVVKINNNYLDFIKNKALNNERKRARISFHKDNNQLVQEMLIAAAKQSYVRPHKHHGKSESFHIIEGELDVIIFNDHGKIKEVIEMGGVNSGKKFYYRLDEQSFHTIVVKSELVVFHETTNGPFRREETIYADWAPKENDYKEIMKFNEKISNERIKEKMNLSY